MFDRSDPCNGRVKKYKKRLSQANWIKEIALKRYPSGLGDFAKLIDFNVFIYSHFSAITNLVEWKKGVYVTEGLPNE
jgi:hypothetical protein